MNKKIWIVAGVVFIVIMMIPHSVPNYADDTDFPWTYVPAAKGELVDQYHGFVYPTVLKICNYIWDDWVLAGRVISAGCMALSLVFIFQLAGWTGVVLLLVSPIFLHCGYCLTNDALAFMLMCFAYWAWRKHTNKYLMISGLIAGLAVCTRYQMGILLVLGFFIYYKNMWRFWIPALTLVGFQVFLNLRNGIGILGSNTMMNIMEKGSGFNVGKILQNLVVFPIRIMTEAWPFFGVLFVFAVAELIRRKRWELVIMAGLTFITIALSFYSLRFFLPMMLPVIIGSSYFVERRLR